MHSKLYDILNYRVKQRAGGRRGIGGEEEEEKEVEEEGKNQIHVWIALDINNERLTSNF